MESQCATFTVGRSCTVMGEKFLGTFETQISSGGWGRGDNEGRESCKSLSLTFGALLN